MRHLKIVTIPGRLTITTTLEIKTSSDSKHNDNDSNGKKKSNDSNDKKKNNDSKDDGGIRIALTLTRRTLKSNREIHMI
jgi:hypothetical protein